MKELNVNQVAAVNGGKFKVYGKATQSGWEVGFEISF